MEDFARYLAATGESIVDPLVLIWQNFLYMLPGFVSAFLILLVGYFFGLLVEKFVRKTLRHMGLDELMTKHKLSDALRDYSLSAVCGKVAFWYVMIVFLHSSLQQIQVEGLNTLVSSVTTWLPNLVAGAFIFIGGLIVSQLAYNIIIDSVRFRRKSRAEPVALAVKGLIVFFFSLTAAGQIGIRVNLIEQTWLIVLASVGLALAIGCGIALGSALKPPTQRLVKKHLK